MSTRVRESIAAYGQRRKWTVEEYYLAAAKGVFRPGEKLELIDGEVYSKLSPQLSRHASGIQSVSSALHRAARDTADIRIQLPLHLDQHNEPEPDICVVRGSWKDYVEGHPAAKDVLLIVEVADSSHRFDRGTKLPLYARFEIPEVWILDLKRSQIEVYRGPHNEGYRLTEIKKKSDMLAWGDRELSLAEMIP